jgi:hypothetical protein
VHFYMMCENGVFWQLAVFCRSRRALLLGRAHNFDGCTQKSSRESCATTMALRVRLLPGQRRMRARRKNTGGGVLLFEK